MKVIKKLGYRQEFDLNKIKLALKCTAKSINETFNNIDWNELKPRIQNRIDSVITNRDEIFFWEIDDVVIDSLLRSRFKKIAREYIETRSKISKDKLNDIGLSPIAMSLLKERYLKKDNDGNIIETTKEMLCRVGTAVANQEKTQELREKYTEEFNKILTNLEFLPNSPCLVSAGTDKKGTWFACFAYSVNDSLESIFNILHKTARTFQLGGGVGISIAKLREKDSSIDGTGGKSSGSVAFLELFDTMCKTVKAGGFRRGALMALTKYNHPDIDWFIHCKKDISKLNNMNISVMVDDSFFKLIENNEDINLISPYSKKVVGKIPAKLMLESIATNIWETGEPGLLFYNRMNRDNPTPHLGNLELTNPCSESNLLNGEACNLGSINLVRHLNSDNTSMDWDKLANTTKLAVRFLDNMIDGSPFPDEHVKNSVLATRKIGIGVMGFHDAIINLGIKYSSEQAIEMAEKIMGFIQDVADQTSKKLACEKGTYLEYKPEYPKRRNAIVTIQAPTGSISLIAGVSPGIEPNFYRSYSRELDGVRIKINHPLSNSEYFEIASEITPEQHLKILSSVQKHVENSVSKTCNVPENTTVEEIKDLLIQAHKLDIKGITIFRENCYRDGMIRCEDCKLPGEEA
jgi:ribonucleoside-diphosphate reductase alpha chain